MESVKIKELKVGDFIDLEGDEYADPDAEITAFQFLYAQVAAVETETVDCIAISIEGVDTFGFPPDHEVRKVAA